MRIKAKLTDITNGAIDSAITIEGLENDSPIPLMTMETKNTVTEECSRPPSASNEDTACNVASNQADFYGGNILLAEVSCLSTISNSNSGNGYCLYTPYAADGSTIIAHHKTKIEGRLDVLHTFETNSDAIANFVGKSANPTSSGFSGSLNVLLEDDRKIEKLAFKVKSICHV